MWLLRATYRVVYTRVIQANVSGSVLWLWRLVAGLSPQRAEVDPGSVLVIFVVGRVAQDQVFLRVLRFFPVSIIPPLLHTPISDIEKHWTLSHCFVNFSLVKRPLVFKNFAFCPHCVLKRVY